MEWRNSVVSPQGYRYYIVIFESEEELYDFTLPEWFDYESMGIIFLYEDEMLGKDGPDSSDWVPDIGYPSVDIPPVFIEHLKVLYPYNGTVTHLAFVRVPILDSEKAGQHMYAWTIGTEHFDTVYTDTLNCTTSTQLWYLDGEDWHQSNATIEEGVWTDLVSVVVENSATNIGMADIYVRTSEGTYSNAEASFVGCLADFRQDVTFTVNSSATGWKWADLDVATNPRVESPTKLGLYLSAIDAE